MPTHIVAYFIAHTGKSLLWTAADMLTLYMLIAVCRMDPASAGAAFLVGLAANAVADLAAGIWLDRARAGVTTIAMAALAVSAVAFPLTIVAGSSGFVPVLLAMLLFRVAYSFYDVPHNTLLSRLSDSSRTAMALSRGRAVGTGVAGVIVCLLLRASATDAPAFTAMVCVLALAGLLLGFAVVPLLRNRPVRESPAASPRRPGLPPLFLVGSIVGIVALGLIGKALLHLPAELPHAALADILLLLTVGRMAASLVPVDRASGWVDRHGLAAAYLASAVVAVTVGRNAEVLTVLLLGFASGLTNLLAWAKLPSLVRSAQGYGTYTMASKLALGAAGMTMAALLGIAPLYTSSGFRQVAIIAALLCVVAAILFRVARRGLARMGSPGVSPA